MSEQKPKPKPVLVPNRMHLREHANQVYVATVEEGTKIEDLLAPDFWAHVAPKFRPYDEVIVRTDDGVWYARMLVLWAGRTWVKMKQLEYVPLTSADVDMTQVDTFDDHEVKWGGPENLFRVLNKKTKSVIRDKFPTKLEGETWLREHLKA